MMTGAHTHSRRGFTLVEILVVIAIIAILAGLLTPAITGAIRRANSAAVSAEIQTLGNGIEAFKNKYGEPPPSRLLVVETGNYQPFLSGANRNTVVPSGSTMDITYQQLAERSLRHLRKFFPRVRFNTTDTSAAGDVGTYDFNGDGVIQTTAQFYVLDGTECLVFFLGGIPSSSGQGMVGFAKDPTNPFRSDIPSGDANASTNRDAPFFEFKGDRLLDPNGNGVPSYVDALGRGGSGEPMPYAYFSANGSNAYDPNDVNIAESHDNTGTPAIGRYFTTTFQAPDPNNGGNLSNVIYSPAPNPYTAGPGVPTGKPVSYINPTSFQIVSSGHDRFFGFGGQYSAGSDGDRLTTSGEPATAPNGQPLANPNDPGVRQRERDNLTNFSSGALE